MKEAGNSHRDEGDGGRWDFAVLPPGHRCRRFDAKTALEEAITSPSAGWRRPDAAAQQQLLDGITSHQSSWVEFHVTVTQLQGTYGSN